MIEDVGDNPVRLSVARAADVEPALRVLLVEDHAALAEATAEFLRSMGLEVGLVSSGREALTLAVAFRPKIVLCDMNLPDMNGLDVARAVRTNSATKDILFAIYTAMSETDIQMLERRIKAPEVDLFLSKPLTEEKLDKLLSAPKPYDTQRDLPDRSCA